MRFFKVNAFTGAPGDDRFLGNPALVVYHDLTSETASTELSLVASKLKLPITVGINTHNEIRFYECNDAGSEMGMCGHGSLAAAAVHKLIYPKHDTVTFVRNPIFIRENKSNYFSVKLLSQKMTLMFPYAECYEFSNSVDLHDWYNIVGVLPKNVVKVEYSSYGDLVFLLDSSHQLRSLAPDFRNIGKKSIERKTRLTIVAAPSEVTSFDWEIRAFGPHLGLDEDIACGSANGSLFPLLFKLGLVKLGVEYVNIFPYKADEMKRFGGIQWVTIFQDNITVSGYTSPPERVLRPI